MNKSISIILSLTALILGACQKPANDEKPANYTLEELKTVEGFNVPECVLHDPASGINYVSNMETSTEGFWDDDGKAYISTMKNDGTIIEERWLDSTKAHTLNSLKGMTLLNGYLYFADNKELKRCSIKDPSRVEVIPLPNTVKLNDVANDGETVLVTDTAQGAIYRVSPDGTHTMIKSPPGVNGVTFYKGKYYAVSIAEHDVYEIYIDGKDPVAFGLADNFTGLDGIEVLEDGSFIISDVRGGAIFHVPADRSKATKLVDLEWAADIGIDRKEQLIFAPSLKTTKVVIFKLQK